MLDGHIWREHALVVAFIFDEFKGVVNQKLKLFTHPNIFVFFSVEHKRGIFAHYLLSSFPNNNYKFIVTTNFTVQKRHKHL